MTTVKLFLLALICFVVLDLVWFSATASTYRSLFGDIGRISNGAFQIRILPAIVAYVLMAISVAVFLAPLIGMPFSLRSVLIAALLGVIVYGVYDFTNAATLVRWPLRLIVIDVLWGACAYALTANTAVYVLQFLQKAVR